MNPTKEPPLSADQLLTDLLKAVSRSFYLTLRILPAPVRTPISIAYLLARTSDTIADTEVLKPAARLASLESLRQAIAHPAPRRCDLSAYLQHQTRSKERELLQRVNESLDLLTRIDETDLDLIREVLETIISGQRLDLERFQHASKSRIVCLQTAADLDDYTYRVAGCVGAFWTKICYKYLAPSDTPSPELLEQAVRFGKGLQMVNILRDLAEDLDQGRCYLPQDRLRDAGIEAQSLIEREIPPGLPALFQEHIEIARAHLQAGWQYTNQLPWGWFRIRLACAWPILLGLKTLDLIPVENPTDPTQRAKVTRADVRSIILKTIVVYPFQKRWASLASGPTPR